MKVVLRQDVPKVGRKGEVKEVSDGFARNCLLPQGKCDIATPGAIKRIQATKDRQEADKEASQEAVNTCAATLAEKGIEFVRTANEDGTLFAAVSSEDLLSHINELCAGSFDAKHLIVAEPVKSVGEHTLQFAGENFKVTVKGE